MNIGCVIAYKLFDVDDLKFRDIDVDRKTERQKDRETGGQGDRNTLRQRVGDRESRGIEQNLANKKWYEGTKSE